MQERQQGKASKTGPVCPEEGTTLSWVTMKNEYARNEHIKARWKELSPFAMAYLVG